MDNASPMITSYPICKLWAPEGGEKSLPVPFSILVLKRKRNHFFLGAISLMRVMLLSPKTVKNLPRTYEKLRCKGKAKSFSTHLQTTILLLLK